MLFTNVPMQPVMPSTPRKLAAASGERSSQRPVATVEVLVDQARGVPAMDSNGFSDPYVIASLGGRQRRTAVCPKTLTPTWRETFRIEFSSAEILPHYLYARPLSGRRCG